MSSLILPASLQGAKDFLEAHRPPPTPVHPFDDTDTWLSLDFSKPPWSDAQIAEFQKKIDSAFGAEDAIVLAWSGDRRYGDVFLNEKGEVEHKPVLLFLEVPVNERDYIYAVPPRWVLLEKLHVSQYEDSWEASSWVQNEYGESVRVRPEQPPKFMYKHFHTVAKHDVPFAGGYAPRCCENMFAQKKMCFGKYAEPSDVDIAVVGETRRNMDAAGVAQRNDTERSKKILMDGAVSTRHFMQRAKEQGILRAKDVMIENSDTVLKDIVAKTGCTMTAPEIRELVKEALDEAVDNELDRR